MSGETPTMKTWRLILPLAVFVILLGFLWVGLSLDPREVPSPLIGKPAPSFALATLHEPSKTLSSEDMKGQVWLLNVWASWCVSCRAEHPLLMQLGVLAYCTYLIHLPAIEASRRILGLRFNYASGATQFAGGLIGVALTLMVAKFSWYFLEKPMLRRGHAYKY